MEPSLMSLLPEPDRAAVLAVARPQEFAPGEVIFRAGDPGDSVHVLVAGHVALRVTASSGEEAMVRLVAADGLLGEQALVATGPRDATATALDPVETLSIATDDFDGLRSSSPALERALTHALVTEVGRLSVALSESLHLSPDKRILRRLLDAAVVFGTDAAPADVVPLTEHELGQLAGVPATLVNRTLRAAQENAFLRVTDAAIEIYDAGAIAHQAR